MFWRQLHRLAQYGVQSFSLSIVSVCSGHIINVQLVRMSCLVMVQYIQTKSCFFSFFKNWIYRIFFKICGLITKTKRNVLMQKKKWGSPNSSFSNVIVVIATDETFDALKIVLCINLVSFVSKISMLLFEVEFCLFPTFQETVGSHLKNVFFKARL